MREQHGRRTIPDGEEIVQERTQWTPGPLGTAGGGPSRRVRDHDLHSALLALDAGLRTLRSRLVSLEDRRLVEAMQLELHAARRALNGGGDVSVFDLGRLVRAWAALDAHRGQRIRVDIPSGLLVAAARSSTVEVLRNLLDNVSHHAGAAAVEVRGRRFGSLVELRVADDGPGITEPTLALEPGYSTGAGRGLGLPNAAQAMRAMGGDLAIEADGPGCAILLWFPAASAGRHVERGYVLSDKLA